MTEGRVKLKRGLQFGGLLPETHILTHPEFMDGVGRRVSSLLSFFGFRPVFRGVFFLVSGRVLGYMEIYTHILHKYIYACKDRYTHHTFMKKPLFTERCLRSDETANVGYFH